MNIRDVELPGVLLFEPVVYADDRGFFLETFREEHLTDFAEPLHFVQENHSRSKQGVLRGLHYQVNRPQGKLVRVLRGAVFDVAVDLRSGSPTFGRSFGVILDDISHHQLFVPPGFAHGFLVLSEVADVAYKCTSYYDPDSEGGIRWNDEALGIEWPLDLLKGTEIQLSSRDRNWPTLAEQQNLPS